MSERSRLAIAYELGRLEATIELMSSSVPAGKHADLTIPMTLTEYGFSGWALEPVTPTVEAFAGEPDLQARLLMCLHQLREQAEDLIAELDEPETPR